MSKVLSKLGFDKHHRFERFGVMSVSLFVIMAIIFTIAFVNKTQVDNEYMTNTVIYTNRFKTSLSDINGVVHNIYKNKDDTKAFIVLNIEDISKISVNAKNYQLFLTGCKRSGDNLETVDLINKTVNGSIYMFGSTGYMGIYLVDNKGFPSQLYDLVVRCNSRIVSKGSSLDDESNKKDSNSSFDLYDQFRIYFNPGGTVCDRAEFLDKENWGIVDAYEECISRNEEKTLRDNLSKDIEELQLNLSAIDEYTERLRGLNVVIPDTPTLIEGDTVIKEKDEHLTFKPKTVLAKGFDFDWYNGSIRDGYLDKLCGDMTYSQYLTKKNLEVEGTAFNTTFDWVLSDGTPVKDLDMSINTNKTINDTISLLTSAWNTYYKNKQAYQCTDLTALLYLELDTRSVESDYTVNSDKDTTLIVF